MIRINRTRALGAILASMTLTVGMPSAALAKKSHTNKGKHCVKYKKYHGKKRCSKYSKK